jgi:hypothetical protein
VACCYEQGNEPPVSVKGEEFRNYVTDCNSMDLVIYLLLMRVNNVCFSQVAV